MKGKIISHEDFMAVEKLSDEHLKMVKKRIDCHKNTRLIICAEALLCIIVVLIINYTKGLSWFDYIYYAGLILLAVTTVIAVMICVFGKRISAAAYGTVTELICAERIVLPRCAPEFMPWEDDKFKKYKKTPLLSEAKYYYYINAKTSEGCLQHICCWESDYKQLAVGDKVIIIKYGNDTILCLPAI